MSVIRKAIVKEKYFRVHNDLPILEIVIEKQRRDFQGKFHTYLLHFSAYNKLAISNNKKINIGDTIKLEYRIESKKYNDSYYTRLILEKIKQLETNENTIPFNDDYGNAEKEFMKSKNIF